MNDWKRVDEILLNMDIAKQRRADAKRYYPDWPKVFLTDRRIDIREYQKNDDVFGRT